ncbi:Sim4 and Mal2 associated protein 4 [Schizosaccharomyces cryophilus OY26]|uniref:Sim4 and Mal2 associated protein 4 n=1 Tax=Schizosaccharomyces cryophilus (strain OY26 / ATCC MYA-4695 / CBS 11777 / NBRC 106824 / NRRL Y48691) TaxID=653667 RepID=S9VUK2_SCHCR|nr:Sim4 and Mal2 associated protein 4 [Schizosaccharomyces cryophilus OY26]EPY49829.1 Sim4 and Mal2 associated protein 4 [Schizosaccharomyces cryophilus OY26]
MEIYDKKKSFLTRQIQLLSHPLQIPKKLHTQSESNDLNESVVERVFQRLHLRVKRHIRFNYSQQATQHVAAQIRKLYEQSTQLEDLSSLPHYLYGEFDLRDIVSLQDLPHPWPFQIEQNEQEKQSQQDRYDMQIGELISLLSALDQIKQERKVLEDYRMSLEPFLDTSQSPERQQWKKNPELSALLSSVNVAIAKTSARLRDVPFMPSSNSATRDQIFPLEKKLKDQHFRNP